MNAKRVTRSKTRLIPTAPTAAVASPPPVSASPPDPVRMVLAARPRPRPRPVLPPIDAPLTYLQAAAAPPGTPRRDRRVNSPLSLGSATVSTGSAASPNPDAGPGEDPDVSQQEPRPAPEARHTDNFTSMGPSPSVRASPAQSADLETPLVDAGLMDEYLNLPASPVNAGMTIDESRYSREIPVERPRPQKQQKVSRTSRKRRRSTTPPTLPCRDDHDRLGSPIQLPEETVEKDAVRPPTRRGRAASASDHSPKPLRRGLLATEVNRNPILTAPATRRATRNARPVPASTPASSAMGREPAMSAPRLETQQQPDVVDGWLVPAQAVPTPRPRDLPPNLRYLDEADDVYLPLWSANDSVRTNSPRTRAPTPGPSAPRRPTANVSRTPSDSLVNYLALAEVAERTAGADQTQQRPSLTVSPDPNPYRLAAEAAGFVFMPAPEEGFPIVNFSHPFALYDGQTRARTAALEADTLGPNALIQIAGEGYPQLHRLNYLMETLGSAVQAIAYAPSPLVSSPAAELSPAGARRTSPSTWVILNISQDVADRLISGRVWISPAISFFAYGRPSQTQRYLFTLTGFRGARDYQAPIEEAVRRAFRTPAFVQSTTQLLRANPDFQDVTIVVALHRILTSIAVRITPLGNGNLIASVDCDSPTNSYEEWRHWREMAVTLGYETLWHGQGTPWRNPPCAVCHGADHPTHLCPFPRLPGWVRDSANPRARANSFLLPPSVRDPEGSMATGTPGVNAASVPTNANTRSYGNERGALGSRASAGPRATTNPRGNQNAHGGANGRMRTPAPMRGGQRTNDEQPNKRARRDEDHLYD